MAANTVKSSETRAQQPGDLLFGPGSSRRLPMKVVVWGLGRTGTTSLKQALDILGIPTFNHTHAWVETTERVRLWTRAIDWKYRNAAPPLTRLDWDELLGDYMGCTDAPACFFAQELSDAYPDAKVIHLERDFEPWFASCVQALAVPGRRRRLSWQRWTLFLWNTPIPVKLEHMDKKQRYIWGFEWLDPDAKEKARVIHEEYSRECRAAIPEGRRLDFRVQDGWAPLCKHLGVEIPTVVIDGERVEVPFPRGNEASVFQAKIDERIAAEAKLAIREWITASAVGIAGFLLVKPYLPFLTSSVAQFLRK